MKIMNMGNKKPNIIFIVLDSLRAGHVSCYGYKRETTPNIDKIAKGGVIFKNAISQGIATAEVHASWFTGLYLSEHGVHSGNKKYINDKLKILPHILKQSGYETVAFSNNPFVSKFKGMDRGFNTFYDPHNFDSIWDKRLSARVVNKFLNVIHLDYLEYAVKYKAERMVDKMIEWLKHNKDTQPFFMFSIFIDTHIPHYPPRRFMRKILNVDISNDLLKKINSNPKKILSGEILLSQKDFDVLKSLYDANIVFVDSQLRRLFKVLSKLNLVEDTVLIITADHGDQFGEHNLIGHSMSLYDCLLKVPLIIRYPQAVPANTIFTPQVQTIDLFTTILETAGLRPDQHGNGRIGINLLNILKEGQSSNLFAYAEQGRYNVEGLHNHPFNSRKWCIRTNKFKYIKSDNNRDEFYNLESDPEETDNLINQKNQEKEELKHLLNLFISNLRLKIEDETNKTMEADKDTEERLKALGYF